MCRIEENLDSRNIKSKFHCVSKFYILMFGRVSTENDTYTISMNLIPANSLHMK